MDLTKIINLWITSLVRLAIAGVGGYFVRKGVVDQSLWEATAAALVTGAIAGFWALWEKYQVKKHILTALAMPRYSTPAQLQEQVKTDPVTQPS